MNIDKYQHCFRKPIPRRKMLDEVLERIPTGEILENGVLEDVIPEIRETAIENLRRKSITRFIVDDLYIAFTLAGSALLYKDEPFLAGVFGTAGVIAAFYDSFSHANNHAKAKNLKDVYQHGVPWEDSII